MSRKALRVTLCFTMLLYTALRAEAYDSSRKYHVSFNNQPIALVLQSLTALSGQAINFQTQQLSPHWKVTLDTSATILQIVQHLFKGQPYLIEVDGGDILILLKPSRPVSLRVLNAAGQPLEGVTIRELDSVRFGVTNREGYWRRALYGDSVRVALTMIGYHPATVTVTQDQEIVLTANVAEEEPVVIAYGRSPRRRIVGNVSEVKMNFATKPFPNAMDALRLVNGVLIRNKTDIPWGSSSWEIEGSRTIQPLSADRRVDEPLIVINGIPGPAQTGSLSQLSSVAGDPNGAGAGLHPLSFLNVDDIESITVLKDGTATAIYGARGANGVILVNLRKPASKELRYNLYVMTGMVRSYRRPETLNTQQFLDLRRAAQPSGTNFNKMNFPELYMDSSLYTNWADALYKHTGMTHTTQFSASGSVGRLYWTGSFNYRRDSYVLPVHNKDEWARFYTQLQYYGPGKRLQVNSFVSANIGENVSPAFDLTPIVFATPQASGRRQFDSLGIYNDPFRLLRSQYRAQSNYYFANLSVQYSFGRYFKAKVDGGLGRQLLREKAGIYLASLPPDKSSRGHVEQAGRELFTWLVEPQVHFNAQHGKFDWQALVGGNYQQSRYRSNQIKIPDFTNDDTLKQYLVYPAIDTLWTQYRLLSFFGRVNLSIDHRYVLEGSIRRDGSSRFAPDQRFGTFYSFGGAWLPSETRFWKRSLPQFNFAKLRVSHGLTGNDQVADYAYMGQYSTTGVAYPYGGYTGWVQIRPGSNTLSWGRTRKTEAGLQLEYQQRYGLEFGAYWHRSFNQVMKLPLASQSGFSQLDYWNFPAEVDNRGWDASLYYKLSSNKRWKFSIRLNYTRPTNRLHSFPTSVNPSVLKGVLLDKSLSARKVYRTTGVDKSTGLYTVKDWNGDSIINDVDMQEIRDLEVSGYGSLAVQVQCGRWAIGFILEGRKQTGYTSAYYTNHRLFPGRLNTEGFSNQLLSALNRWPGTNAHYQRPATSLSDEAQQALDNYLNSDAAYTDQSYICLRHAGLEYSFPGKRFPAGSIDLVKIFLQGQNLFVWSKYKEGNPMLTQPFAQPVTRVFSVGAQVSFK